MSKLFYAIAISSLIFALAACGGNESGPVSLLDAEDMSACGKTVSVEDLDNGELVSKDGRATFRVNRSFNELVSASITVDCVSDIDKQVGRVYFLTVEPSNNTLSLEISFKDLDLKGSNPAELQLRYYDEANGEWEIPGDITPTPRFKDSLVKITGLLLDRRRYAVYSPFADTGGGGEPITPPIITGINAAPDGIRIRWSAAFNPDGDPITAYIVTRVEPADASEPNTVSSSQLSFIDSGGPNHVLTSGLQYCYRVTAVAGTKRSDPSDLECFDYP